jgi:hypothetical protein
MFGGVAAMADVDERRHGRVRKAREKNGKIHVGRNNKSKNPIFFKSYFLFLFFFMTMFSRQSF